MPDSAVRVDGGMSISDEELERRANAPRDHFIDARVVLLIREALSFYHNHDEPNTACIRCLAEDAKRVLSIG